MKLAQRASLVAIGKGSKYWQTQRRWGNLAENLSDSSTIHQKNNGTSTISKSEQIEHIEEESDFEIRSELEDIIEILLNGLRDRDTIVRYSASKGLGRLSCRLPRIFSLDIIEAVLSISEEGVIGSNIDGLNPDAWHGGLLGVAELVRRGVFPTNYIHRALRWVTQVKIKFFIFLMYSSSLLLITFLMFFLVVSISHLKFTILPHLCIGTHIYFKKTIPTTSRCITRCS